MHFASTLVLMVSALAIGTTASRDQALRFYHPRDYKGTPLPSAQPATSTSTFSSTLLKPETNTAAAPAGSKATSQVTVDQTSTHYNTVTEVCCQHFLKKRPKEEVSNDRSN